METLCIMCGKEAEQGGYTARIQEHVLRPLCGDCQRLCSGNPDQVLREYTHLFASPASSSPPAKRPHIFPNAATSNDSSSSPLHSNGTFVNRYRDLYRAASVLIGLGTTVKTVGIVVATVIFFFWLIVGDQRQPNNSAEVDKSRSFTRLSVDKRAHLLFNLSPLGDTRLPIVEQNSPFHSHLVTHI